MKRTRAIRRAYVDAAIWRIAHPDATKPVRAQRPSRTDEWLRVVHSCQLCHERVGSDSLAVCLWPPESDADSRWSMGRARLCESCVAASGARVRVQARAFYVEPKLTPSEIGGRAAAAKIGYRGPDIAIGKNAREVA